MAGKVSNSKKKKSFSKKHKNKNNGLLNGDEDTLVAADPVQRIADKWLLCTGRFAVPPKVALDVWKVLIERYLEPHRRYHTLRHVQELLEQMQLVVKELEQPYAVLLMIFFHDAIYDPQAKDNEDKSADLFSQFCVQCNGCIPPEIANLVRDGIMHTKHHMQCPSSAHKDIQYFLDMDIAILGANKERYVEYMRQIRQEYRHVPHDVYGKARAVVLQQFLAVGRMYRTPFFHARFETTARGNLQYEISVLSTPEVARGRRSVSDLSEVVHVLDVNDRGINAAGGVSPAPEGDIVAGVTSSTTSKKILSNEDNCSSGHAAGKRKRTIVKQVESEPQSVSSRSEGLESAVGDDSSANANLPSPNNPIASSSTSRSPSHPTSSLVRYLRDHLNEFTSAIDVSTSHRLGVLSHTAPRGASHCQPSNGSTVSSSLLEEEFTKPCRTILLEPAVTSRTESIFQRVLVSAIASVSCTPPPPPRIAQDDTGKPISSSVSAAAAVPVAVVSPTPLHHRIVQVHNTVREFTMRCQTCVRHGVDHNFVVTGSVGDIHVVTPPPTTACSLSISAPHTTMVGMLPPDTALILEVKNAHALNHTMLSQALLELELHRRLVCCQGREYVPADDNISPAAHLKKVLTNCACTEASDVVLVLWGSESAMITSRCGSTGNRNLEKEEAVIAWVKDVHARLPSQAEKLLVSAGAEKRRSEDISSAAPITSCGDAHNIISHVSPLPTVTSEMVCADGSRLGSISWEVLSLHPSISMPFHARSHSSPHSDSIHTTAPPQRRAALLSTASAVKKKRGVAEKESRLASKGNSITDKPCQPVGAVVTPRRQYCCRHHSTPLFSGFWCWRAIQPLTNPRIRWWGPVVTHAALLHRKQARRFLIGWFPWIGLP